MSVLLTALALAATPLPEGLVEDPCLGVMPMPASVEAYRREIYDPARTGPMPKPPADIAAYRDAVAEHAKRDWANLCFYRADNIRVAALPPEERRVVFMGDSITEGWSIAHPGFFGRGVINRGISGQTTPQMLVRFQADVIALKPRIVHIMAGTNDVAGNTGPSTIQDVKNNLMAMTTLARANGIRVVLASIPPAARFAWKAALRPAPQIRALNSWLRDYAKRSGATFIDYHAVLSEPDGAMRGSLTFDGVHPDADGYRLMEPLALRAIR